MIAEWSNEEECLKTIKSYFDDHNYLLDPHTAIAVNVVDKLKLG